MQGQRQHRSRQYQGGKYLLQLPILFFIILFSSSKILSPPSSSFAFFCDASLIKPQRNKKRGYSKQQSISSSSSNKIRMSMENVTCYNYTQPLDHFNPGSNNHTFEQRYCIYDYGNSNNINDDKTDTFQTKVNKKPIFFYTGNESPIDEYVNNTGLMWELGIQFSALIVFAEHRFEGLSVPHDYFDFIQQRQQVLGENSNTNQNNEGCFTYLTTTQTLADYASLLSFLNPNHQQAVITFGGSYGGMLSAWMRFTHGSSVVAGSIASSAPVWGLPKTLLGRNNRRSIDGNNSNNHDDDDVTIMDRASYIVGQALRKDMKHNQKVDTTTDGTKEKGNNHHEQLKNNKSDTNFCFDNLLATWPLITFYGRSEKGRQLLSNQFKLCTPLKSEDDVHTLLEWAQSPWFDLAEGDFPYPSSYIPYALGEGLHNLPAWPLQEACHGSSGLNHDFGIVISGNVSDVVFDIQYGQDPDLSLVLSIDWDEVDQKKNVDMSNKNIGSNSNSQNSRNLNLPHNTELASDLFSTVRDALSIWFNVTKSLDCFDVVPAINEVSDSGIDGNQPKNNHNQLRENNSLGILHGTIKRREKEIDSNIENTCQEKIHNETVWSSLVCNENLNLIMTYARGMGRDFFWPPSHPRDQRRYQDTIKNRTMLEEMYEESCSDPKGVFGYPDKSKYDPYSTFLDNFYGGLRIGRLSNVVFSNGMLDPWSAAGVYSSNIHKDQSSGKNEELSSCSIKDDDNNLIEYDCAMVQNITKDGSVIALLLDVGAHHLDLMYSDDDDPTCATVARLIQKQHITKWIDEWNEGQQYDGTSCSMFE